MIEIQKELINQNMQSKMILQVHDELVFDMLDDEKDKLIPLVKGKMEQVIDLECLLWLILVREKTG